MIEPQVELVEGEELLRVASSLPCGVTVRVTVLELDGTKDRVVKSAVEGREGEGERVGLVRL